MRHVLEQSGEAKLAAVLRRGPLLGFDFDGTLAPIVARPERARLSQSIAGKLRRLVARLPVAIVTGRRAADVQQRLDFEPFRVVGNHGADVDAACCAGGAALLDEVRRHLAAHAGELRDAGISLEDKDLSIALHYRLAPHPGEAAALIHAILRDTPQACRVFPGRMAENVVPAGLPDKAAALRRLVQECGADCALFVGDDLDDEPASRAAPDDWLTVRIGRTPASQADYFLDSAAEVGLLLDRIIAHAEA